MTRIALIRKSSVTSIILASERGHNFISLLQNLLILIIFLLERNTTHPIITATPKISNEDIKTGYKPPVKEKNLCVPDIPSTRISSISIFTMINPTYTKICIMAAMGRVTIFDCPIATFAISFHLRSLLSLILSGLPSFISLAIVLTLK